MQNAVFCGESDKLFQSGETLGVGQLEIGQDFAVRKRVTRQQRVDTQCNRYIILPKLFESLHAIDYWRCTGVIKIGLGLVRKRKRHFNS